MKTLRPLLSALCLIALPSCALIDTQKATEVASLVIRVIDALDGTTTAPAVESDDDEKAPGK